MAFIPRRVLRALGSPLRSVDPFIGPPNPETGLPFPFNIDGMVLYMPTHNTTHLWQEAPGQFDIVPLNNTALTSGSVFVGQADDPTGHTWIAASSSQRPFLQSPAALNGGGWLFCSGAQALTAKHTSASLAFIHETLTGTILFKMSNYLAGTRNIISNHASSNTERGFLINMNATNHLTFVIGRGASNPQPINHTSTGSVSTSGATCSVVIRLGHPTSGSQIRIGVTGSWETMTINNAVGIGSADADLRVGCHSHVGTSGLSGTVGHFMIFSRSLSDSEIAQFDGYNPSIDTTGSLIQQQPFGSGSYNFNYLWYDFNDPTTLFSGSTSISGSASALFNRTFHKLNLSGSELRTANTDNNNDAPQYSSSIGGAFFDGTNDNLRLQLPLPVSGGAQSIYAVVRNNNANFGSTFYQATHLYWASLGASHPSGALSYVFMSGSILTCSLATPTTGTQVLELRRNGSSFFMSANGQNAVSYSGITGSFGRLRMVGDAGIGEGSNMNMSGNLYEIRQYNAFLNASQSGHIINELRVKYGL